MQVGVRVLGHVVVEHNVDPLDVHASTEQVGGHQDSPLEVLELLVAGEPGGWGEWRLTTGTGGQSPPHRACRRAVLDRASYTAL